MKKRGVIITVAVAGFAAAAFTAYDGGVLTRTEYGSECRKAWRAKWADNDPKITLPECIAACDGGCWSGYARAVKFEDWQWFFIYEKTRAKCEEKVRAQVDVDSESFREPYGCVYASKSLQRTISYNARLSVPIYCIAKSDTENYYEPILEKTRELRPRARCVSDLKGNMMVTPPIEANGDWAKEYAKPPPQDCALFKDPPPTGTWEDQLPAWKPPGC